MFYTVNLCKFLNPEEPRCVRIMKRWGQKSRVTVPLTEFFFFRENNITTFFIVPPPNRRKPFLFNTLNVRNNLMTAGQLVCDNLIMTAGQLVCDNLMTAGQL